MKFNDLHKNIRQISDTLRQSAVTAINSHLTVRNWLIGFYIVEFKQNGEDRAKYGAKLLQSLSENLNEDGLSYRNLRLYRQFYLVYPEISVYIPQFIKKYIGKIWQSPIAKLQLPYNESDTILQTLSAELQPLKNNAAEIWQTPSAKLEKVKKIVHTLSFSHLSLLLPIDDPQKRQFYETECIKGTWSVRELKRQINTLYYERSGMSRKPEKLSENVQKTAEVSNILDIIKSPFTFEFLGLKAQDVVYETDLEKALLEHLEEFLLELGYGFCFEARQKRMLIGGEYFFCDLIFYHRVLKCHVLVDLKVDEFSHEYFGQLKTYVNYYKKEITQADDNPPVGILLVTNKNDALVEFATADSDHEIFVSKYLLQLPSKEKLAEFVNKEYAKL